MKDFDMAQVERKIGYTFKDKSLLKQAFVHSSYAHAENISDNERMEFFGDSILEYLSSEYIYNRYKNCDAGELSKIRASVVSADGLRPVVDKLQILDDLLVASGSQIRKLSRKIEANLYEALLCAIYFDGGMDAARSFVLRTLKKSMDAADKSAKKDCKTLVQEYCQERKMSVSYKREEQKGPDNKPIFTYSLWIDGKKVSCGSGTSVKSAQQAAASKIVKQWRID